MRRTTSTSPRLALSIVKNREEAEDQVQNSFLNAWRSLGKFQLEAKFSTWMRTIVVNQSLMHLRTKRRAPVWSLDDDREDGLAMDPLDTPSRSRIGAQPPGNDRAPSLGASAVLQRTRPKCLTCFFVDQGLVAAPTGTVVPPPGLAARPLGNR